MTTFDFRDVARTVATLCLPSGYSRPCPGVCAHPLHHRLADGWFPDPALVRDLLLDLGFRPQLASVDHDQVQAVSDAVREVFSAGRDLAHQCGAAMAKGYGVDSEAWQRVDYALVLLPWAVHAANWQAPDDFTLMASAHRYDEAELVYPDDDGPWPAGPPLGRSQSPPPNAPAPGALPGAGWLVGRWDDGNFWPWTGPFRLEVDALAGARDPDAPDESAVHWFPDAEPRMDEALDAAADAEGIRLMELRRGK